jgi:hypothetical protein
MRIAPIVLRRLQAESIVTRGHHGQYFEARADDLRTNAIGGDGAILFSGIGRPSLCDVETGYLNPGATRLTAGGGCHGCDFP